MAVLYVNFKAVVDCLPCSYAEAVRELLQKEMEKLNSV